MPLGSWLLLPQPSGKNILFLILKLNSRDSISKYHYCSDLNNRFFKISEISRNAEMPLKKGGKAHRCQTATNCTIALPIKATWVPPGDKLRHPKTSEHQVEIFLLLLSQEKLRSLKDSKGWAREAHGIEGKCSN